MFLINDAKFFACETFVKNELTINEEAIKIMSNLRSELEKLNYKALIISVIK
jgi:hypothetical protein